MAAAGIRPLCLIRPTLAYRKDTEPELKQVKTENGLAWRRHKREMVSCAPASARTSASSMYIDFLPNAGPLRGGCGDARLGVRSLTVVFRYHKPVQRFESFGCRHLIAPTTAPSWTPRGPSRPVRTGATRLTMCPGREEMCDQQSHRQQQASDPGGELDGKS